MRVAILPPRMTAAFLTAALFFSGFMVTGFNSRGKMTLIGVVSTVSLQTEVLEGFKAGMVQAGYAEGQNLKYLYRDIVVPDEKHIDSAIHELLSQDISLLVSMGSEVDFRAKVLTEGTDTPALFLASSGPVETGLVDSIRHPGGNITGVKVTESIPKALEWLLKTVPNTRLVYLPYNPDDPVSGDVVTRLAAISPRWGIELFVQEVQSAEEAVATIETLPENISAVFLIPSVTLNPKSDELNRAAILRKIPTGAAIRMNEKLLMTFTDDFFNAGQKASRLAKLILSGLKPADLPVETAEVSLILNLRTAEEIGISIPDEVLVRAHVINR